jgi:hypothetical protein
MSEDKVELKILEPKLIGSDVVTFRLEDGALVKLVVCIDRSAVAVNYKNPDGSPHYQINAGMRIIVVPPDRKYFIPRGELLSKEPKKNPIVM